MATYKELQDQVLQKLKSSDSGLRAAVKFELNNVQSEIASIEDWTWARRTGSILTTPKSTTTVTISSDRLTLTSSAVNFYDEGFRAGAFVTSDTAKRRVASVSTYSLTLATEWPDTTSVEVTVYQPEYALTFPVRKLAGVRDVTSQNILVQETGSEMDNKVTLIGQAGNPSWFGVTRYSSGRNMVMALYPMPDTEYNIEIAYYVLPQDMSADGDYPTIPDNWHWLLVAGTLSRLLSELFRDDPRASAAAERRYLMGLEAMRKENQVSTTQVFSYGNPSLFGNFDGLTTFNF